MERIANLFLLLILLATTAAASGVAVITAVAVWDYVQHACY